MDDLATLYWTAILIFVIFAFAFIISVVLGIIQSVKKGKGKPMTLKSSILTVGIAYLFIAFILYFIEPWGKVFALVFLPIISVFTLILVEVFHLLERGNKK